MPRRFINPPGRRRWAVLTSLFLCGVSISPAAAVENVRREVTHFFQCLGLMIGDPPAHEDNCLPNRFVGPDGTIQSMGDAVAAPAPLVPVVPVVVPPPPPPAAPDPCACGACYAI